MVEGSERQWSPQQSHMEGRGTCPTTHVAWISTVRSMCTAGSHGRAPDTSIEPVYCPPMLAPAAAGAWRRTEHPQDTRRAN